MTPTRAISIRQPWAWLIVHGHKTFENRTRPLARPGKYLVHAGKHMTRDEYAHALACVDAICRDYNMPTIVLPEFADLQRGGIGGWFEVGEFSRTETDDPWSFGSGYPITAAGVLPFTPCAGALGTFQPCIPVIQP